MFDKKATASLLFICVLEIVHVGWAYGTDKWFDNLAEMGMDLNKPTRYVVLLSPNQDFFQIGIRDLCSGPLLSIHFTLLVLIDFCPV